MENKKLVAYRTLLNKKQTEVDLLSKQYLSLKEEEEKLLEKKILQDKARIIIQTVSAQTQNNIRNHINNIVTTALSVVFGQEFTFNCVFIPKRGKTECEMFIVDQEKNEFKPIDATGGGVLDIISFALRCAFWSIKPTRKTMIFDEPFKYLSYDLMDKAVEMIQIISKKLEIQMIIVSHSKKLIQAAEETFYIDKKSKVSFLKST